MTNLRIAAGLEEGEFAGTHWQDEWVYKWLEAAASIYGVTGDEALNRRMDEVIEIISGNATWPGRRHARSNRLLP